VSRAPCQTYTFHILSRAAGVEFRFMVYARSRRKDLWQRREGDAWAKEPTLPLRLGVSAREPIPLSPGKLKVSGLLCRKALGTAG